MRKTSLFAPALLLALSFSTVARAQEPDPPSYEIDYTATATVTGTVGGIEASFSMSLFGNALVIGNTPTPPDITAPATPANFAAASGDGQITLTWDANAEPDLAGYSLYMGTDVGGPFALVGAAGSASSPQVVGSLDNGTEYSFQLTALDTSGNESAPAADSAVPADVTAPSAPTGLAATPGDGTVALDWNDNAEGDLASYTVYRSLTSGSGFAAIATGVLVSSYDDNTAANGTTYYYRVTAVDEVPNESSPSAEVSATPEAEGIASLDELTSTLAVWIPDPATWTLDGGSGRVTNLPDSGPSGLALASITATGGPLPLEDHWGTDLHALQVDNLKYLRRVDATPSVNDFSVVYVVDSGSTGYVLAHRAVSLQAVTYSAPPIQLNHNGAIGMDNSDATPTSNISGYYSSSVEGPIVVRYERNRTAGTVSLWANGVRLIHLTGQTLTDYSATAEDIVLGHSSNNSGPSYIGQVWIGTDPDDALEAERFLGQQLLDAAPTPACNYMGLTESDRSGALIHYAPRLALAYADAATNDPVTVLPDLASLVAAVANTGTGPFFALDEFGSGLHGVEWHTADYLTHADGYPADLNDVAIILAIKTPTSGTTGYMLNVGGAASGSGNPLQAQILSGNPRAILNDATVGSPINLDGTSPGADTACVLRIERVRNTGSADGYFRLYVNGALAAESTNLSLDDWSSAQDIYIGASSGASHDTKLGEIVFCDPGDAATLEAAVMSTFGVSP